MNVEKRDELIFGEPMNWDKHDIVYYSCMDVGTLTQLISLGFADPEMTQNDSPTIEEFVEFMTRYPSCVAHGYVVSPNRDDCRVSIEGLVCSEDLVTNDMLYDFVGSFRCADEFTVSKEDGLYCWWD